MWSPHFYIWSEKLCEDIFLSPRSGCGGFLAEVKEQIVLTETCEGSQVTPECPRYAAHPAFPKRQGFGCCSAGLADIQAGIGCSFLVWRVNASLSCKIKPSSWALGESEFVSPINKGKERSLWGVFASFLPESGLNAPDSISSWESDVC